MSDNTSTSGAQTGQTGDTGGQTTSVTVAEFVFVNTSANVTLSKGEEGGPISTKDVKQ